MQGTPERGPEEDPVAILPPPLTPTPPPSVGGKLKDAGSWLKDYGTAIKHGRSVSNPTAVVLSQTRLLIPPRSAQHPKPELPSTIAAVG